MDKPARGERAELNVYDDALSSDEDIKKIIEEALTPPSPEAIEKLEERLEQSKKVFKD